MVILGMDQKNVLLSHLTQCPSDAISLDPFCQVIGPYLFGTSEVKEVLLFLVLLIVNLDGFTAEWQKWIEYRIGALGIQSVSMTSYKLDMWLDLSGPLFFHLSSEDNNIEHHTLF